MAKRELIEPKPDDKQYVRRDEKGSFTSPFTKGAGRLRKVATQDRLKYAKHEARAARAIATPAPSRRATCGLARRKVE
jgi:hypothetical protein